MGGFGGNFGTNFAGIAIIPLVIISQTKLITASLCVNNNIKKDLCVQSVVSADLCVNNNVKTNLCVNNKTTAKLCVTKSIKKDLCV